jgi:hypothetical protein
MSIHRLRTELNNDQISYAIQHESFHEMVKNMVHAWLGKVKKGDIGEQGKDREETALYGVAEKESESEL